MEYERIGEVVLVKQIDDWKKTHEWFGVLLHSPSDVGDCWRISELKDKEIVHSINPLSPRLIEIVQRVKNDTL